ncbi:MAG TPA: hypothetical protein VKV79_04395, partial [Terriglobia bacterium]|nr:hypothetical protein [Terriglobia bacterium]
MKPRSSALPILVVVALTVILIVLAFLQVRWSNQVSHADRERLQTSLHTAVNRFRRDFDRELLRVCWTFDVDSGGVDPKSLQNYADRYEDWVEDSLHPALVDAVFVWKYQGRPG